MLFDDPKINASIQSALLFMVIANPITYRITNTLFFRMVTNRNNSASPGVFGLLLHATVFGLLAYLLMTKGVPDFIKRGKNLIMDEEVTQADDVVKGNKMIAKYIMEKEKPVVNVPVEHTMEGLSL